MKPNLTLWKWWKVDAVGAGILFALSLVIYVCGVYPLMSSHKEYEDKCAALASQREHSARFENLPNRLRKGG